MQDRFYELQSSCIREILAHPTLNNRFQPLKERRELAGEKSVRAKRDTEVLKRKTAFDELGEAEDGLLCFLQNTCKENEGFGCISDKARNLPKDSKLLEEHMN
jgi:hypothetical protein